MPGWSGSPPWPREPGFTTKVRPTLVAIGTWVCPSIRKSTSSSAHRSKLRARREEVLVVRGEGARVDHQQRLVGHLPVVGLGRPGHQVEIVGAHRRGLAGPCTVLEKRQLVIADDVRDVVVANDLHHLVGEPVLEHRITGQQDVIDRRRQLGHREVHCSCVAVHIRHDPEQHPCATLGPLQKQPGRFPLTQPPRSCQCGLRPHRLFLLGTFPAGKVMQTGVPEMPLARKEGTIGWVRGRPLMMSADRP